MKKELSDLIQYRFARARETLEESVILADSHHWNACVNRLYYACFYAVLALLSKHNLSSSKHAGVRSFFNQHFVKSGIISKETAVIYNLLFERRQEGDHEEFVTFKEADVRPWLKEAQHFIDSVTDLIKKQDIEE
jgi:uncharacterized protein